KELNSPWTNWMKDPNDYVNKHSDLLGSFQDGDSFESTTTNLNRKYAKKRTEILSKVSVKEMLRPLFCTIDINLQAAGTAAPADLMIDLLFANPSQFFGSADGSGGIGATTIASLQPANYQAAITALGQKIPADFDNNKSFADTPDAFMYPERSNLDHQYV